MLKLIFAFVGTITCAVFYNTPPKKLPIAGLLGVVAWISINALKDLTNAEIFSVFLSALIVGICSELMARFYKSPALSFSVSGAIPLLPGFSAYSTAKYIIDGQLVDAAYKGIFTITCAGSIALGIMLATAIFKIFKDVRCKNE